jgi:hypothetical protein
MAKRYYPYEPPEGPLEPPPPMGTEAWLWTLVIVLLLLALIGTACG